MTEKRERDTQASYGRACTLYPRSVELLEQLDVADDIIQASFIARSSVTFKGGKRVTERGWNSIFDNMLNTFHDYTLNIRQRHSEDILLQNYSKASDNTVNYGWKLVDFKIDRAQQDGHNITAVVRRSGCGGQKTIRWYEYAMSLRFHMLTSLSKYLVGADGGQSYVRERSQIAMEGDRTTYKWIRIDGNMETDMPDANIGYAAIETPNHGNVLWVKLNKDAHRIGFALTPRLRAKYADGITQDQAIEEAVEAMKPFSLKIKRLDWWTNYRFVEIANWEKPQAVAHLH